VLSFDPGRPQAMTAEVADPCVEVPIPDDDCFATIETRTFESEREVEYGLIMSLLEQLGYVETDCVIEPRVRICIGR